MLLRKIISSSISVYDGISPALLATISLSQNIKGSNHHELVQSLKKSNILQSQLILDSLRQYDRAHFTNVQSPYQNKPYAIGQGECMTDIFTHSIILSNLEPKLKNDNLRVLDIGTGHGYLSFVIHQMIRKSSINNFQVIGVDCNQNYIEQCKNLKKKFNKQNDQSLKFQVKDVNDLASLNEEFDAIIGGFFIQPNLSKKLKKLLKAQGIGIWPSQSESGQALFKYKRDDQKFYLIQTLFSQQRVKSSVDQYFIKESDQPQKQETKQQTKTQDKQQKLQHYKKQKQTLQSLLKHLIVEQKKRVNKSVLTLQEMRSNDKIKLVLQKLKRYK